MPELPEVHTTAQKLNKILPNLAIADVWSDYFSALFESKQQIKNKKYFQRFKKDIVGLKIINVDRRAKNVLINLSGDKTILVHMKMTGHLLYGKYKRNPKNKDHVLWVKETWIPNENKESLLWDSHNRFIHLVISLSNGKHLILSDMRKFAKVAVLDSSSLKRGEFKKTGPEPLEKNFSFSLFKERVLKKPRGKIKQILMDQEIIAGIGNIYSDEILWLAKIHPESVVLKIPDEKLKDVFKMLKITLQKGIDSKGDSTSDYRAPDGQKGSFQLRHKAYRKTEENCQKKNCRGKIHRTKIGGRSAHFCSNHQTLYN